MRHNQGERWRELTSWRATQRQQTLKAVTFGAEAFGLLELKH